MPFDHRLAYLIRAVGGQHTAHNVFVAILVEHTSVGIEVHVAGSAHHFVQRESVVAHPFGIQHNLILLDVTSQYGYLRHTTCREQAWADGPVGYRTQIQHRGRVGRQSDNQHLAQNG